MNALWQASTLGPITLKNRFVRSATFEGLALPGGFSQPKLSNFYRRLTCGGVGLIITGHMYVNPAGRASARQVGIFNDALIDGIAQVAETIHREGAKAIAQIAHAGAHAAPKDPEFPIKGPSAIDFGNQGRCEAMSLNDIAELTDDFAQAAVRAKKAGFDGVQLHMAHGYCLSQFLSPWYNHRTDDYGGSVKNRSRLPLAVVQAVRQAVGPDYPLLVKINGTDALEGGLTIDEMLYHAKKLEENGVTAIELSGGCGVSKKLLTPVRPVDVDENDIDTVYHLEAARRLKKAVKVPVILVGGIKSIAVATKLLETQSADYIALSRPLICEPDLIDRWENRNPQPSLCIRCSKCFQTLRSGKGVSCTIRMK